MENSKLDGRCSGCPLTSAKVLRSFDSDGEAVLCCPSTELISNSKATPIVALLLFIRFQRTATPNVGLQLRRAISIQAEGIRLLEKHAIAPSAARLCWAALLIQRDISSTL